MGCSNCGKSRSLPTAPPQSYQNVQPVQYDQAANPFLVMKQNIESGKYNGVYFGGNGNFKDDMCGSFGVQTHPKKDRCFDLAWSYGNREGLYGVLLKFHDLVTLLK